MALRSRTAAPTDLKLPKRLGVGSGLGLAGPTVKTERDTRDRQELPRRPVPHSGRSSRHAGVSFMRIFFFSHVRAIEPTRRCQFYEDFFFFSQVVSSCRVVRVFLGRETSMYSQHRRLTGRGSPFGRPFWLWETRNQNTRWSRAAAAADLEPPKGSVVGGGPKCMVENDQKHFITNFQGRQP